VPKKQNNTQVKERDHKKYEIKSMEELFIEDDGKKNDEINVDEILLTEEKDYDDVVINSFENLNLEDFKAHGYKMKIPGALEHFDDYHIGDIDYNNAQQYSPDDDNYQPYEEEKVYSYEDNLLNEEDDDIESFSDSLPVCYFSY
jgi:hypothetical protein